MNDAINQAVNLWLKEHQKRKGWKDETEKRRRVSFLTRRDMVG
jgi:hypothetical protein